MNWTTDVPTEPGWYWFRDENYDPTPVWVTQGDFDELMVWIGGFQYVRAFGGEWQGPIEPQEGAANVD
jgi:hypothetical protein